MSDQFRTVAKLFGALLMMVGVLVTVLAGLCSASVLMTPSQGEFAVGAGVVMIFGGIPIVFGLGVFAAGLAVWRGPRKAGPDPHTFE